MTQYAYLILCAEAHLLLGHRKEVRNLLELARSLTVEDAGSLYW